MAAAIRAQLRVQTQTLDVFLERRVKVLAAIGEELVLVRGLAEIRQHRQDDVRQQDWRLLALLCLEAAAGDLVLVPVNHGLFRLQQFAGHHAGVDHQQDIAAELVAGVVVLPELLLLIRRERHRFDFLQLRKLDEMREVRLYVALRTGAVVKVRE